MQTAEQGETQQPLSAALFTCPFVGSTPTPCSALALADRVACSFTFCKTMKTSARPYTFSAVMLLAIVVANVATAEPDKSPVPQAVIAINKEVSKHDRRAIIAREMRGRGDRLGGDSISPIEGEVEYLRLVEWIEQKWQLSDDSELRRYFTSRGIIESQEIASVLIAAWLDKLEHGKINEPELFNDQRRRQELRKEFSKLLESGSFRTIRIEEAEKGDAEQPATRSQSGSKGGYKPQPEAEGRSR